MLDERTEVDAYVALWMFFIDRLLGVLLETIYPIDPMSIRLRSAIPRPAGEVALAVLIALTVSSAVLTVAAFREIRRRLTALEAAKCGGEIDPARS